MNKATKITLIIVAIIALILAADYFWWNYLIFRDKAPKIPVPGNGNLVPGSVITPGQIQDMGLPADDLDNLMPMPEMELATIRPLNVGEVDSSEYSLESLSLIDAMVATEKALVFTVDAPEDQKKVPAQNNVVKAQRAAAARTVTGIEFDLTQYARNPRVFSFEKIGDNYRMEVDSGVDIPYPIPVFVPSTATGATNLSSSGGVDINPSLQTFQAGTGYGGGTILVELAANNSIFRTISVIEHE